MRRILVITNLFPNAVEPNRGTFNAQQFAALREHCEIEVIAPTAWRTPADRTLTVEQRHETMATPHGDILVHHPRYYYVPGTLRVLYPWFYLRSIASTVQARWEAKPFDLIFGTWLYPDCVAAAQMAFKYRRPLLVKNHGTDVIHHAAHVMRRRQMAYPAAMAHRVFCVSSALAEKMRDITRGRARTQVLPNGVDTQRFTIVPRAEARRALGLPVEGRLLVFVGNLKPVKGLNHLIAALGRLGHALDWQLAIVGRGELHDKIRPWARAAGIADRVTLVGEVPHRKIPAWMNAADVLVLPSRSEGSPNVLLESMACGTPVVASAIGGIPDITSEVSAILVPPEDRQALTAALAQALSRTWDRQGIRASVAHFTWRENAVRLREAIEEAVGSR